MYNLSGILYYISQIDTVTFVGASVAALSGRWLEFFFLGSLEFNSSVRLIF